MKPGRFLLIFGTCYAVLGVLMLAGAAAFFCCGQKIAALILLLLGVIFAAIGFPLALVQISRDRRKARLLTDGERIQASVVSVEPVYSVTINNRCPYRVICRYTEGGTDYLCCSELLRYPPQLNGSVTVYRDPANWKHYYVDVDSASRPTVCL